MRAAGDDADMVGAGNSPVTRFARATLPFREGKGDAPP